MDLTYCPTFEFGKVFILLEKQLNMVVKVKVVEGEKKINLV